MTALSAAGHRRRAHGPRPDGRRAQARQLIRALQDSDLAAVDVPARLIGMRDHVLLT